MKKQTSKKFHRKKEKPQKSNSSKVLKKEEPKKLQEITKTSKLKSPSFYRSIPAKKLKNIFSFKMVLIYGVLLFLLYFLLILAITSISIDIYKNSKLEQEVYAKRNELYHQKDYWEKVVERHPGYRDAYYNLAILEIQLGNKEKAREYLDKVFDIDPNYEKGRELEKVLSIK